MGDRGQILINRIYLYSHWGATDLITIVKSALQRGTDRWDDHEYLARIIFNEMTKGDETGTTGYGISAAKHDDIWRLIKINEDEIIVQDYDKQTFEGSFKEFIAWVP